MDVRTKAMHRMVMIVKVMRKKTPRGGVQVNPSSPPALGPCAALLEEVREGVVVVAHHRGAAEVKRHKHRGAVWRAAVRHVAAPLALVVALQLSAVAIRVAADLQHRVHLGRVAHLRRLQLPEAPAARRGAARRAEREAGLADCNPDQKTNAEREAGEERPAATAGARLRVVRVAASGLGHRAET